MRRSITPKLYDKIPERCVELYSDLEGKTVICIKIRHEDVLRLPSHITTTQDEIDGSCEMILPSDWTELIANKLPLRMYGFEKKNVEFARKLMECGITPQELKEHLHDFEWVAKKIQVDMDRIIHTPIRDALKSQESWAFFNDNKPGELDCSKMGWKKCNKEDDGSTD